MQRFDHNWSIPACIEAKFTVANDAFNYGVPDRPPCGVIQLRAGLSPTYHLNCQVRRESGLVPHHAFGRSRNAVVEIGRHLDQYQCSGRYRSQAIQS